jgi:hypothetical protein
VQAAGGRFAQPLRCLDDDMVFLADMIDQAPSLAEPGEVWSTSGALLRNDWERIDHLESLCPPASGRGSSISPCGRPQTSAAGTTSSTYITLLVPGRSARRRCGSARSPDSS